MTLLAMIWKKHTRILRTFLQQNADSKDGPDVCTFAVCTYFLSQMLGFRRLLTPPFF